jgi:hypothetical protein
MTITCLYCPAPAVSGSNDVNGTAYAAVCAADLARVIADFGDVQVPLIPQPEYYWHDCECGCQD